MRAITILLIEDNPPDVRLVRETLKDISHFKSNLISVVTLKDGCEQIQKNNVDIILLDLNLPDSTGRQTFQKVIGCSKEIPIILITGIKDEELPLKLIKEGAQDYLTKQSLNPDLLGKSILYSIERQALLRNIKIHKVQIDRIEKERILIAKLPSQDPDPILRVAGNGKLLYINEAGIKLLPDWQLIINETILSRLKDIIDPIFIEGTNIKFELCHRELIYSFYAVPFIEEGYINLYGRDITERKLAEDALRESEESYRKLFENHSAVKIILDPDTGAILDANDAAAQYYGWTREELKHMKIYQINTLSPEEVIVKMERTRSEGRIRFEFRHRRADGSIRDVEVFGSKIEIRGKDVLHSIIIDITERKQAEDALLESKAKYQAIFESTGTATFIVEEDATILMANNECYSVTGYTPTSLIGQKWSQYVAPESLQEMLKNYQLRLQNPNLAPKKYEVKLVYKNGEIRDVILDVSMIPGTKQNIVSILDITERKRAELELILANEAILQSEKNFRRSISESILGIRIVTVDEKTIYANKAFLDIYEFNSIEEFISTPVINRYTPESYTQHQERKEKRKNGHEAFDYEISIIRKNAEIRHVKVSRKKVLWNGIKHYQLINLDITEQKKLTIDLIAAKEHAEESDRLKSAFLANMSHEIRTPMNGILGFAELLKEPKLTGKEQQKYISIIEKSGARMLNIINDIINISKVESGQMGISISETNVNEQIEYIYTFFKPEAEQKGIQISFKNSLPAKEAIIKTDREKIYALFTNLIKNAIKFTHAGSIEFGYEKKGKYLEFFVKDTGIGILEEKKEIIFERFRQGSESITRNYEGAGLGLSISKAYVEMLGGKIWVESEEGKGSTFYFTIPYYTEPEEKIVIKDIVSADGEENQFNPEVSGLKILVAEDDETSEMLIDMAVKMFCKEIITVRTGVEAVEACRNNPDIDLILMDVKMPEMDGYEATRKIRKFNKDIIIIAQTAFGLVSDREKAIDAGCNGYIPKPFNKASLTVLLKSILKNKQ